MFKHRFTFLLIALFIYFLISAFLDTFAEPVLGEQLIMIGVFAVLFLSAIYAISTYMITSIIATVMVCLTIVLKLLFYFFENDVYMHTYHITGTLFLLGTVVLILKHIYKSKRVTYESISAALCAYLLIGVLWSLVYQSLGTGSFTDNSILEDDGPHALYYSLVTLTTLGYGDISPLSSWARMLSVMEAVTGQIYMTVLVAYLVGVNIAQSGGGKKD